MPKTNIKQVLNDENTPVKERENLAKAVLRTFSRFQDAEHTTATARARTAKQFSQFMQPDNVRLFPNLRWLPSRSANPRASHTRFYDRVWAKNDPFWNNNAPGTEWNCKCDIEETDEPVTDNSKLELPKTPRGLEGNPAETGEIFTDEASYIRKANESERYEVEGFWKYQERERLLNSTQFAQEVMGQDVKCRYDGRVANVVIDENGLDEALHSSFGSPYFVLKNYSLRQLAQMMENAEYLGWKDVDLHNSKKSPKYMFKQSKDVFLYYKGKLTNEEPCYIHLCRNMFSGDIYLYSLTTQFNIDDIKKNESARNWIGSRHPPVRNLDTFTCKNTKLLNKPNKKPKKNDPQGDERLDGQDENRDRESHRRRPA